MRPNNLLSGCQNGDMSAEDTAALKHMPKHYITTRETVEGPFLGRVVVWKLHLNGEWIASSGKAMDLLCTAIRHDAQSIAPIRITPEVKSLCYDIYRAGCVDALHSEELTPRMVFGSMLENFADWFARKSIELHGKGDSE